MVDDALESTHALVAFNALDRNTLTKGATIVPFQHAPSSRARHCRPPASRAAGSAARSTSTAGCGAPPAKPSAPEQVDDPNFDSNEEQFYGQDGIARSYATYNVKHKYANARYFLIDSTGVGGGIVRGVVRGADPVEASDGFGYCDPNHIRSLPRPVATWRYGRVVGTRMVGWFAARCTAGQPGQVPGSASLESSPRPPAPPSQPTVPEPAPVAAASGLGTGATRSSACSRARAGRSVTLRVLRKAGVRMRRARSRAHHRRLARSLPAARRRAADTLVAVRRFC